MLIALTSKYKLKDIIFGTAAAILVLNGLAVLAGGFVSEFIPDWLIKTAAALVFLYFAASTIAGDDDDEAEEGGKSKIKFAPLAVFCTFSPSRSVSLATPPSPIVVKSMDRSASRYASSKSVRTHIS